jgi:hypothetical protein
VGFVVDKMALGQVFSKYFGFPCQSSFNQLLHNHPHLSSGAGTIGQKWPQYKGLSPTPLAIKKRVNPEDQGNMFLQSVGIHPQGCMMSQPRTLQSGLIYISVEKYYALITVDLLT